MTDPNENDTELQRTWTPDPDSRGETAADPFEIYFGRSTPDDGPDV